MARVEMSAAAIRAACSALDKGPHPDRHFLMAGPLAVNPGNIQRLSPNLAFLTVTTDDGGVEIELIAKVRDGFLAPLDIDMLCSACAALAWAQVFPEVDTDTGDRLYFHVVKAMCLPDEHQVPHPPHRAALEQSQQEHKQKAASARKSGTSTAAKWGGASNDNRASVFVGWLLQTYSLPWLCSGMGVLDVAGGSGQVAWNLTCIRRCPSIIIDPRPAQINAKQRAYLRRTAADAVLKRGALFRPATIAPRQNPTPPSTLEAHPVPPTLGPSLDASSSCGKGDQEWQAREWQAREWQARGQDQSVKAAPGHVAGTWAHVAPIASSFAQAAQEAGVPYVGQDDATQLVTAPHVAAEQQVRRLPLPRQLQEVFNEKFGSSSDERRHLWHTSSMVVGMHPDEATEAIVDACLRSGKAFAIVPCCVFAETNAHRRMGDGTVVRSWEQFLVYLMEKDKGIQRKELAFQGRNVVLFHMGNEKKAEPDTTCVLAQAQAS